MKANVETRAEKMHASSWKEQVDTFSRPCGNPLCTNRLSWLGTRGRPPVYCSTLCRKRAAAARSRLSAQITAVEVELNDDVTTRRERAALEGKAAALRWMHDAYPVALESAP